jgi:hypothetical protein
VPVLRAQVRLVKVSWVYFGAARNLKCTQSLKTTHPPSVQIALCMRMSGSHGSGVSRLEFDA